VLKSPGGWSYDVARLAGIIILVEKRELFSGFIMHKNKHR
jgi:hypothetical protein